jgi:hypothetical protein
MSYICIIIEIHRLKGEGICTEDKLPSVSSINRIVRSNKHYDGTSSPQSPASLTNYQESSVNVGDLAEPSTDSNTTKATHNSNKLTKKNGQKMAFEKISKLNKASKKGKRSQFISDIDLESSVINQVANDESDYYDLHMNDAIEVRSIGLFSS